MTFLPVRACRHTHNRFHILTLDTSSLVTSALHDPEGTGESAGICGILPTSTGKARGLKRHPIRHAS